MSLLINEAEDRIGRTLEEIHALKVENSAQAALLEAANRELRNCTERMTKIARLCDFIWERREQIKTGPAFTLFKSTIMEIYTQAKGEENV